MDDKKRNNRPPLLKCRSQADGVRKKSVVDRRLSITSEFSDPPTPVDSIVDYNEFVRKRPTPLHSPKPLEEVDEEVVLKRPASCRVVRTDHFQARQNLKRGRRKSLSFVFGEDENEGDLVLEEDPSLKDSETIENESKEEELSLETDKSLWKVDFPYFFKYPIFLDFQKEEEFVDLLCEKGMMTTARFMLSSFCFYFIQWFVVMISYISFRSLETINIKSFFMGLGIFGAVFTFIHLTFLGTLIIEKRCLPFNHVIGEITAIFFFIVLHVAENFMYVFYVDLDPMMTCMRILFRSMFLRARFHIHLISTILHSVLYLSNMRMEDLDLTLIMLTLSTTILFRTYTREQIERRLFTISKGLKVVLEKSEKSYKKQYELLCNIIPSGTVSTCQRNVRERVKKQLVFEYMRHSCVISLDIAGFTTFSINIHPKFLIRFLNEVYNEFDLLVEKYGIEKTKTIGDEMIALEWDSKDCVRSFSFGISAMNWFREFVKKKNVQQFLFLRGGLGWGILSSLCYSGRALHFDVLGEASDTAEINQSKSVDFLLAFSSKDLVRLNHHRFQFLEYRSQRKRRMKNLEENEEEETEEEEEGEEDGDDLVSIGENEMKLMMKEEEKTEYLFFARFHEGKGAPRLIPTRRRTSRRKERVKHQKEKGWSKKPHSSGKLDQEDQEEEEKYNIWDDVFSVFGKTWTVNERMYRKKKMKKLELRILSLISLISDVFLASILIFQIFSTLSYEQNEQQEEQEQQEQQEEEGNTYNNNEGDMLTMIVLRMIPICLILVKSILSVAQLVMKSLRYQSYVILEFASFTLSILSISLFSLVSGISSTSHEGESSPWDQTRKNLLLFSPLAVLLSSSVSTQVPILAKLGLVICFMMTYVISNFVNYHQISIISTTVDQSSSSSGGGGTLLLNPYDMTCIILVIISLPLHSLITYFQTNVPMIQYELSKSRLQREKRVYRRETKINETLLYSTLPKPIVSSLILQPSSPTKNNFYFVKSGSVCFLILKNLKFPDTKVEASLTCEFLYRWFTFLDSLIGKKKYCCDVYKIKATKFTYITVSGLLSSVKDHEHQNSIIQFATQAILSFEHIKMKFLLDQEFFTPQSEVYQRFVAITLGCGVHCGGFCSGIVGSKKYCFDVFGSTINISCRLAQTGEPYHIHFVKRSLMETVKKNWKNHDENVIDYHKWIASIEERPKTFLKGKGNMKTFSLVINSHSFSGHWKDYDDLLFKKQDHHHHHHRRNQEEEEEEDLYQNLDQFRMKKKASFGKKKKKKKELGEVVPKKNRRRSISGRMVQKKRHRRFSSPNVRSRVTEDMKNFLKNLKAPPLTPVTRTSTPVMFMGKKKHIIKPERLMMIKKMASISPSRFKSVEYKDGNKNKKILKTQNMDVGEVSVTMV